MSWDLVGLHTCQKLAKLALSLGLIPDFLGLSRVAWERLNHVLEQEYKRQRLGDDLCFQGSFTHHWVMAKWHRTTIRVLIENKKNRNVY